VPAPSTGGGSRLSVPFVLCMHACTNIVSERPGADSLHTIHALSPEQRAGTPVAWRKHMHMACPQSAGSKPLLLFLWVTHTSPPCFGPAQLELSVFVFVWWRL
jgi:hypothetical protein